MNQTFKGATVKRYHYGSQNQLKAHLQTFLMSYNFLRRLKTVRGMTPNQHIFKAWIDEPRRFNLYPSVPAPCGTNHLICHGLEVLRAQLDMRGKYFPVKIRHFPGQLVVRPLGSVAAALD